MQNAVFSKVSHKIDKTNKWLCQQYMSLEAGVLKVDGAGQQSGTGKEVSMATMQVATTTGISILNQSVRILVNPILTKGRAEKEKTGKLALLLEGQQSSK